MGAYAIPSDIQGTVNTALAGLAAQEQVTPGGSSNPVTSGDITANLVTANELTAWIISSIGVPTANWDQFCFGMTNAFKLPPCPDGALCGCPIVNGVRQPAQMTAQQFLTALMTYQQSQNVQTVAVGANGANSYGSVPGGGAGPSQSTPIPAPGTTPAPVAPGYIYQAVTGAPFSPGAPCGNANGSGVFDATGNCIATPGQAGINNPGTGSGVGQGVLGTTSCTTCQALANNPLLLILIAVAAWFLIRDYI